METVQWLTVVIAAFVAWIGFLQWLTARQKAVFDLFDKRFKIYEAVKDCVIRVSINPQRFDEVDEKFLEAVNEANFLFGDDVNSYLEALRTDINTVYAFSKFKARQESPSPGPDKATHLAAMYRINKFSEIGEPLFAKYIRFTQPVPLITRIDAWVRRRANQLMMALRRRYGS